ncbi:MAG TPA: RedB protein [Planctomycetota bacterium]|nr:RedB protein [Planctomycetota bacterium]
MAEISSLTKRPGRPRRLLAAVGVLWMVFLALGLAGMIRYQSESGAPAKPPTQWPRACSLARADGQPKLLLFAHPQCPCTRATIGELDRIAARANGKLRGTVVMLSLPELGREWTHSELWDSAAKIPGIQVRADTGGAYARQFGVRTSGEVLLYGADGQLEFQGGITASRGHSGDNQGADSIVALLQGRTPSCNSTPVYGCGLTSKTDLDDESRNP